jgi:hypothetical protein
LDTIIQKATTGSVDWGQVAVNGVIGAVGGGVGGAVAGAFAKKAVEEVALTLGQKVVQGVATGAASGLASGTVSGGVAYSQTPEPHTASGYATAITLGGLTGAVTGGVTGGAGAALGHGLTTIAGRLLNNIRPVPETPLPDPYAGVREASDYLQSIGVIRQFRKEALESFSTGTITMRTAGPDVYGIRFYGGGANPVGRYLTESLPATRTQLALPQVNTMEHLAQFHIREGTPYISGRVGPNFGYSGGGQQYYVADLSALTRVK